MSWLVAVAVGRAEPLADAPAQVDAAPFHRSEHAAIACAFGLVVAAHCLGATDRVLLAARNRARAHLPTQAQMQAAVSGHANDVTHISAQRGKTTVAPLALAGELVGRAAGAIDVTLQDLAERRSGLQTHLGLALGAVVDAAVVGKLQRQVAQRRRDRVVTTAGVFGQILVVDAQ